MSVSLSSIAQLKAAVDCREIDSCRLQGNWQLWIAAGEMTAVGCRGNDSCGLQGK